MAEGSKVATVVAPKMWHYFQRSTPEEAAAWANADPAQGAGEAVFSVREDGTTDIFLFYSQG